MFFILVAGQWKAEYAIDLEETRVGLSDSSSTTLSKVYSRTRHKSLLNQKLLSFVCCHINKVGMYADCGWPWWSTTRGHVHVQPTTVTKARSVYCMSLATQTHWQMYCTTALLSPVVHLEIHTLLKGTHKNSEDGVF
jgi:hypothetical protein